jgi:O-antigen ligase
MTAKKRRKSTSDLNDNADRPALATRDAPSNETAQDRIALAIYGSFFAALLLVCSPALDSKFALPKLLVLGVGVLALCLLLLFRARRVAPLASATPALLLALALAAWWVLSTPFALHVPTALFGEYDYYNGLLTHLCCLTLFVVSLSLPLNVRTVRTISWLTVAAVALVALVNVTEIAGITGLGLGEVSTLGDRVAASALMNFAIPFVVVALIRQPYSGVKAALGLLLALLLLSEFLSQGRGPWIGLLVALFILMIGLVNSRHRWLATAMLALGTTTIAGLAAFFNPALLQRFTTFTHLASDESVNLRFVYYRAALRAIADHPMVGIGFENFKNSYPHYRGPDDTYFFSNIIPTMVHNGYLETALNNGIAALLLYLGLVGVVLFRLAKELKNAKDPARRDLLLCFFAALCAYLIQDISGWLDLALAAIFWSLLGLAANQSRAPPGSPGAKSALHWSPVAFAAAMIPVCAYTLSDGYARLRVDSNLFQAQALDAKTQWPEVQSLLNDGLARLATDSRTELISAQLYAQRFLATKEPAAYARSHALFESSYAHNHFDRMRLVNIIALETSAMELGVIATGSDFALKALKTLSETDGDNPDFHAFKAQFFATQNQFDNALAAIEVAVKQAPSNQRYRTLELQYRGKNTAPTVIAK